jgi:small neutral amino acid transporter SnatA (MarC family)
MQRRARYALLGGMWAFFFGLFDIPEVALLLGALSLYWGISSLRDKPQQRSTGTGGTQTGATAARPSPAAPATVGPHGAAGQVPGAKRQQTTAAVVGLVTASLALVIVAAVFSARLVYRDYYECVQDSLTHTGQLACNDKLPPSLVDVLGVKE